MHKIYVVNKRSLNSCLISLDSIIQCMEADIFSYLIVSEEPSEITKRFEGKENLIATISATEKDVLSKVKIFLTNHAVGAKETLTIVEGYSVDTMKELVKLAANNNSYLICLTDTAEINSRIRAEFRAICGSNLAFVKEETKDRSFTLRLTEGEYNTIKENAELENLSMSAYLIKAGMNEIHHSSNEDLTERLLAAIDEVKLLHKKMEGE